MGSVVLIITVLLEVALAIFCIKTRNPHTKLRSWLRISEFGSFLLLTVATIIEWSFRWYLLAFLLLILAAIGTVKLLTGALKKNPASPTNPAKPLTTATHLTPTNPTNPVKPFKTGRTILRSISVVILLSICSVPALVFPQYSLPENTGEHSISTEVFTYTDANRIESFSSTGENRKLTVQFWFPSDGQGKYPLIVFSHGAFGVRSSNMSTYMELAANGYVVCSIDHPYHAAGTVDTDGNLTIGSTAFMQEVVDANGVVYTEEQKLALFDKWMKLRTDDMSFVLDTIIEETNSGNEPLFSMIDIEKIGIMGHSLGGAASVQLGRDRNDIDAVIDIDGTMLGEERGIVDGEVVLNDEPYPLPLLNFYSGYVIKELEATPDYVYPNKYLTSISPTAYEVCIKGSNHMSYTDLPLFSPLLAAQLSGISGGDTSASVDTYYCIETMNRLVLEFFDCYLKGEGNFTVNESY